MDIVATMCGYFVSQIVLLSDFCTVSAPRVSYYKQNKTSAAMLSWSPDEPTTAGSLVCDLVMKRVKEFQNMSSAACL